MVSELALRKAPLSREWNFDTRSPKHIGSAAALIKGSRLELANFLDSKTQDLRCETLNPSKLSVIECRGQDHNPEPPPERKEYNLKDCFRVQ